MRTMKAVRRGLAALVLTLTVSVSFAVPALAAPTMKLPLEVTKAISGDTPAKASTFTFELEAEDSAPMPDGVSGSTTTVEITGEGSAAFGSITFASDGTYQYSVRELSDEKVDGYTYDETEYTVLAYVSGIGTSTGQVLQVCAYKTGDATKTKVDRLEFANSYKAPATTTPATTAPATTTPATSPAPATTASVASRAGTGRAPQTGDTTRLGVVAVVFAVAVVLIAVGLVMRRCRKGGKE